MKAPGDKTVRIRLPKTATKPEVEFTWRIPKWSNAIERDRARTYFQAYAAACAYYFFEKAIAEVHAGRTATFTPFKVPDEAIGCGFHEAVRGVLFASPGHSWWQDRKLSSVSSHSVER